MLHLTSPDVLGGMERVLNPKLLSDEVLKDIFEMRLVREIGMADLLFKGISEKDIREYPLRASKYMFGVS